MSEQKQEQESAGKSAAKLAAVAAGGSAKDIEKESAAARLLGAGMPYPTTQTTLLHANDKVQGRQV